MILTNFDCWRPPWHLIWSISTYAHHILNWLLCKINVIQYLGYQVTRKLKNIRTVTLIDQVAKYVANISFLGRQREINKVTLFSEI